MSDIEFKDMLKKEYGGIQPDPSAKAFEAYRLIIERGRANFNKMAEAGTLPDQYTITEDDKAFIRETCKDLSSAEMLATTMGLKAYKAAMESVVGGMVAGSNETRH